MAVSLTTKTVVSTAKLATNTVAKVAPISTTDAHIYKAIVSNDYDWLTLEVSGNTTTDASVNAVDEYKRQTALLPNSVVLTLIK